jgi:SAM-dependent methyltransferase
MGFTRQDILQNLGAIHTPFGSFATIETRDQNTPCFRLDVIGRIINGFIRPLLEEKSVIEEKIRRSSQKDIEFIAYNTQFFPAVPQSHWDGWDALYQTGESHKEIYAAVLEEITRKKPSHILVVGCGTGSVIARLLEQGYRAEGIENNAQSVSLAVKRGLPVRQLALDRVLDVEKYDFILEPGVLSAGVVSRDYSIQALTILARALKRRGYLLHVPYSRSMIRAPDFLEQGFSLEAKCVPENLFTYTYPKQWYLAQK